MSSEFYQPLNLIVEDNCEVHFATQSLALITATHEKLKIPQVAQDNKPWSKRPATLFISLSPLLDVQPDKFAQSCMHVVGGTVFPEQTGNEIFSNMQESRNEIY